MAMEHKYTYSIIIPHHNSSELLERCLDSIPQRDEFQVIVVDDSSDEGNMPKDEREGVEYYYIKKEDSKGAGKARNLGLKHAKGKWLLFADADDYFVPNLLEILQIYQDSPFDIIYFYAQGIYPETQELSARGESMKQEVDRFLHSDDKVSIRYRYVVPWGKMIKSKVVFENNLFFDEVVAANDVYFSITSGFYANTISADNRVLYYVTSVKGSLSHRRDWSVTHSRLMSTLRRNKFLRSRGLNEYQNSIMMLLYQTVRLYPSKIIVFIKECIKYKQNPFVGVTRWIGSYKTI